MMTFTSALSASLRPCTAKPLDVRERAARGFLALAIRYGLVIVVNLIGTIILSRLLGPGLWGILAIAQWIILSAQEILGRGIAAYLIKSAHEPTSDEVRNVFALQHWLGVLFFSIAVIASAPVATSYRHPELALLICAAGLATYCFAWRSVPLALLEQRLAYFKVATIEALDSVTFVVTAILMAWIGHPISGLALAIFLRGLLPAILAYAIRPIRPSLLVRGTIHRIADFGFSVAAASAVNIAMMSVPLLFLCRTADLSELGAAQMAFSLYANLLFVTAAVMRLGLATYSKLVQQEEELRQSIRRHLEILAAALVPGIAIFAGLAPLWVPLILGDRWHRLPVLLLALAPGYLLASVFWGVLNSALLVSGKHRQLLAFLVAFTTFYALLSLFAAPRRGAVGVTIAFTLSEIIFQPILIVIYTNLYGNLALKRIAVEMLLGLIFMGLAWKLSSKDAAAALFLSGIYLFACYLRNASLIRKIPGFSRWMRSGPRAFTEA